jgi:hypothetical protein
MTYVEAATEVLRRNRRPMTSREITSAALAQGLIEPTGRTPHATMRAALYQVAQKRGVAIAREFEPGLTRAARDSVRWRYRALRPKGDAAD